MINKANETNTYDISKHLAYLIFTALLFIIFLYYKVTNNGLLIWYGDSFEQQLAFYIGGWEKFHSLDFSLWSWSLGLGANYLSYIFYFTSSPFFFITLLFPKEWIPYLFLYLNLFKLGLILLFSYHWLLILKPKRWIALVGSLILTFSGWVIFFFHYNHFLDSFVFYPLILIFIEHWIKTKRYFGLTLIIGLLGITSYYFLYMFIPFIGLYTIYRLAITNDKFPWKRLFNMICIGLLGVGLSATLLLPSISLVIKTPRLSESVELFSHISLKDLFRYVSTFFFPVMDRFDPTYLLSTQVYKGFGWGGGVSLNLFIISPLIIPVSFLSKNKKEVMYRLAFYCILCIFMFFLVFYRILQGSMDVRWYYMISLLNVISVVEGLNCLAEKTNYRKYLFILGICVIGFILTLFFISHYKQWYGSIEHLKSMYFIILALVLFLVAHIIVLSYKPKLLWITISLEALFIFFIPYHNDKPITQLSLSRTFYNDTSAIDYIKEIDNGFYRILNDTATYSSANEPFMKQYKGLSFYLSLYNFDQEDYLARLKSTWSMPSTFGRFHTYNLLSTKYYITRYHRHIAPFGFEYLTKVGNEYIYKNKFFYPLGYATTKTINQDFFNELSYLNQDRLLMDTIITEESSNTYPIYFSEITPLYTWVEPIEINIKLDQANQNLFIESFDIPSVTINAFEKDVLPIDKLSFSQYTWQYNYTGLNIDQKSNIDRININFNNQYESSTLVNVYLEENLDDYDTWFKNTSINSFYNVEMRPDQIDASINIDNDNSWVSTSIPFDKGWTLEINNKIVDYQKVNLGFIGFKLNKGIYKIQFTYTPPFFKLGAMVSFLCFIVLVSLKFINIRNRNKLKDQKS